MFCSKLNKGLKNLHLPLGYLAIFVYSGIEPDKETKNEVSVSVSVVLYWRTHCYRVLLINWMFSVVCTRTE